MSKKTNNISISTTTLEHSVINPAMRCFLLSLYIQCDTFIILSMQMADTDYDGANIEWEQRSVRSPDVAFGQVRYKPGGVCGPRRQRDYQLVLVNSGVCACRVGKLWHSLRLGHVYLFKPGHREYFQFAAESHTHHLWCSVRPSLLPQDIRQALEATDTEGIVPSECFSRIVSAAFFVRAYPGPPSPRVVNALALALFCEFITMSQRKLIEADEDLCAHRALRYMEDHFSEHDCLRGARQAAGCSANALLYKFARISGVPPGRYLWQLRTEKGIELLVESGLSVAEISARCGFKNQFHFSRCVRRLQGRSPRDVRCNAWM